MASPPPEPTSRKAIRWLDYGAMLLLLCVIIYRFVIPRASAPVPAHTQVLVAHGKPVLVDLSSTR